MQMVSSIQGTFTGGPWIHLCLPAGRATMLINGTCIDISLNSMAFRQLSSGGIGCRSSPLALACTGILPLFKGPSHVIHTHSRPSKLTYSKCLANTSAVALLYLHTVGAECYMLAWSTSWGGLGGEEMGERQH